MQEYILSIDSGTTSARAIIFDKNSRIISLSQQEFTQHYPHAGWVEHDPEQIWEKQVEVIKNALDQNMLTSENIAAIGITNQRETTVIWDKETGKPVYNAIVWQCRRTSDTCKHIKERGLADTIKAKTGLVIDAYFSATKIMWILDHVEGAREKAENGQLLFGTIDTYLIWKLTKGKLHITDYSNASRTMLFNINDLEWDQDLLDEFNIPKSLLPKVVDSSEVYGYTDKSIFGSPIKIAGIAGDQQAALFGQGCFYPGMLKNTYGTGCFVLMNTGDSRIDSHKGLISTIAWKIGDKVTYALEGSVFNAGSSIQWLRDELRMISDAPQSEYYAKLVDDSNGVYVVPAFTGLGAPYWDMYARGGIFGITRGTKREHIVRATLESLAFQSRDVIDAMMQDAEIPVVELRVDGGASSNDFLMQFQSDILETKVKRPLIIESTALGVCYLAGLAVNYWDNVDQIYDNIKIDSVFNPQMDKKDVEEKLKYWKKAVSRTMDWLED